MSGFAARNACGDGEEGTADQAARSVRCRADAFGVAGVIVLLLALSLYFLRDVSAAEASAARCHLGTAVGRWANGGPVAPAPGTCPGPPSPAGPGPAIPRASGGGAGLAKLPGCPDVGSGGDLRHNPPATASAPGI